MLGAATNAGLGVLLEGLQYELKHAVTDEDSRERMSVHSRAQPVACDPSMHQAADVDPAVTLGPHCRSRCNVLTPCHH